MAEKRTIELEIQDNSKSLKAQYREAVAELQKVSEQYGETSEQAIKAARAAAELKDQIEFSKGLVDAFNPDAKFKAVEGAINGVLNGFQAFEGGLALLGVESEDLQKTMVRLQGVMALTQGINGVMEAGDSFKKLGAKAADALKGIRTGIAATGIGVFVVALGTIVAYWDDIKAAVSGVSEEQKKLNKQAEKNAQTSKEQYDNLQLQENSLRLQGKSEKEILKIRIDKLNTTIKDEEARIKGLEETSKLEIAAAKRNQEITKMIIQGALNLSAIGLRLLVAPIDMVLETANLVSEKLGFGKITATNLNKEISKLIDVGADIGSKFLFDPAETKAESEANIKEAKKGLEQMKSDRDGFLLQLKQGNEQSKNESNKNAQEQLDVTRQIEEERNRIMEDSRAKDLDAIRIKYKYDKEEAEKNLKDKKLTQADFDKLIAQQTESRRADEKGINDKWDKLEKEARDKKLEEQIKAEDEKYNALQKAQNSARDQELFELMQSYDAKFELAKNNAELEKALTEAFNKEQATIIEKYRKEEEAKKKEADEKEKARIQQLNKDRFQLAKDGLQLISDITSLFGVQDEKRAKLAFQVDKAAKISSATIAGYEAVLEAYKTGQKSPLTAVFPGYPYVQAGLAGAFAAVSIAKIAKSKFQSSGGGGGSMAPSGGGGDAAPMTANFSTIGSSGINQLAQLQQTPTQAYVVSGEVTSAQALDRNRVQNATL